MNQNLICIISITSQNMHCQMTIQIQLTIRDSQEPKYFENKNHPEHSKWKYFKKHQGQHQNDKAKINNTQLSDK